MLFVSQDMTEGVEQREQWMKTPKKTTTIRIAATTPTVRSSTIHSCKSNMRSRSGWSSISWLVQPAKQPLPTTNTVSLGTPSRHKKDSSPTLHVKDLTGGERGRKGFSIAKRHLSQRGQCYTSGCYPAHTLELRGCVVGERVEADTDAHEERTIADGQRPFRRIRKTVVANNNGLQQRT